MKENTNTLLKKIEVLNKECKFKDIIDLLPDEVLEKEKSMAAELYVWRGYTWYDLKEYDKAFTDFSEAIAIDPNYELALYNRGLVWIIKRDYDKAISDFTKAIEITTDYADHYYNAQGMAWKAKEEYNKAISDYNKAIEFNPNFANAYYNRGLAKKENEYDPDEIKRDFEKYLDLTIGENGNSTKYAKYYIEVLDDLIMDSEFRPIRQVVNEIKNKLLIKEDCVHYTSLSVFKKLILEESKFRLSEGNFMNDPSEGKEFFNFLYDKPNNSGKDGSFSESFSPKPFIGSFVVKSKYDDLNMWRFYGKEDGVEAKGCAITLRTQEFIDDIKDFLSNEVKEARLDDESDINFYRVAYVEHDGTTKFYIPNSDKNKELDILMVELKEKVNSYTGDNKTSLEKYLNTVAFLFKSDAYKNENEVRLIVKGIEFEKNYKKDLSIPRVYIELVSIKDKVSQITLGPKVDKVSEWIAAFHYSYGEKTPNIVISNLPYK